MSCFYQEMPDNECGGEQAVMMWRHCSPESDAGAAAELASASSVGTKMLFHPLFLSFGSSFHRKQKASMPMGSDEAGRRCTVLPLPVISRFLIIQIVLSTRTGKPGCCILPTVLSHTPYCRSICSVVCFKAAKLKTRSRFQIKAAVNHYS